MCVDYWGNDIKSFHAQSMEACAKACFETKGCGAIAWHIGGRNCWLKRKAANFRWGTWHVPCVSVVILMRALSLSAIRRPATTTGARRVSFRTSAIKGISASRRTVSKHAETQ